jgi:DNA replication and repair protein RecF
VPLSRLTLTDFRSYREATLAPAEGFVVLTGDNGAGKTNILEAVSLFAPGRGLRGAALGEMARNDGPGGFGVAGILSSRVPAQRQGQGTALATGTLATAPERRQVRIKSATASVNALSEWLSVLWLTPAMDRLFSGSAGDRRRFLDRLVLAIEPSHASHAARYEAAMRARNKLLAEPDAADPAWLAALEVGMAEHGAALGDARARTVEALGEAITAAPDVGFPRAALALDGWPGGDLARSLRANRGRDAAAGRAVEGPHRQDLAVHYLAKRQPAARASTGEQKALLLNIILGHAELVAERRGAAPILLLDEVAAHLDPSRRSALFARLEGRGQVWMTGTEAALFDGLGEASRFWVAGGTVHPA